MSDSNKQLNTTDLAYLYKKTEKLVSALYLLSSFISDKEPVKWQLREVGLKLLSKGQVINQGEVLNLERGSDLITLVLSFLSVSHFGGIISQMNYNILKSEFENLQKMFISNEGEEIKGAVLPDDFFTISDNPQPVLNSKTISLNKGQSLLSDRLYPAGEMSVRTQEKSNKSSSFGRKNLIINLLKKNKELGIKDFTSSIKDCSEKTIQRELASLVSKGQIRKQGEKRWSRYMLR